MTNGYTRGQIAAHWLTVALIAVAFFTHEQMKDAWRAVERGGTADTPILHIAAGIGLLVLSLWRVTLRLKHGAPPAPAGTSPLMHVAANLGHLALYGLILALPLAGMAAWFLRFEDAGDVHEALWTALWIVALIHIAAALYHQFVLKDGLIRRMIRPG